MPVYEFRCNTCGRVFELLLSMDSSREQVCPDCAGSAVRIISRTGDLVKGPKSANHDRRLDTCDRSKPCCGRDEPCDHKPCEDL